MSLPDLVDSLEEDFFGGFSLIVGVILECSWIGEEFVDLTGGESLMLGEVSWFWFLYFWMRYFRNELLPLAFENESLDNSFFLTNSLGFRFSSSTHFELTA